jgi:SpoVK/Ycf46/Vps4 family AAA+-type ATPase
LVFEDLDSLITPQVRSFFLNAVDGVSDNEGILMVGSTNYLEKLDDGISKRPSRFDRKYEFGLPDQEMRQRYCQFWQNKLKGSDKSSDIDLDQDGDSRELQINATEGIEFPDVLVKKIAEITDEFSFAYMQEAFVSTLLIIAGKEEEEEGLSSPPEYIGEEEEEQEEEEQEVLKDEFEMINLGKEREHAEEDGKVKDPLDKYVLWKEIKVQIALLKKEIGKDS